ncbi:hypothetical protein HO173_000447 [Letharia columbiana]|uniref:Uncharacterized protein n=1 Tax=Letharia columbiana TaxID=112416 RepID=A0A8H6LAR9_9LECA|nr:uncharacterized protein HO173_000447 [Letharia columbiana]KAF6241735.1 hypothetical protein HO173_000447 [Letharia columbiana]
MNERLIAGVGVNGKLGKGRVTLQRVSGDVLKVVKLLYGKRVMAGSEAQLLVDEAYAANQFERNHRGPLLGQYSHCPEPKDRVSSPGNDPSGYTTDESGKTDLQTSQYNLQRQVTSILPMPDFTETDNAQL